MNPEVNIQARAAIDEAAAAIQNLVRAFTDDRRPAAVRNDLDQGRHRLRAALENVDIAMDFLVTKEQL